MLITQLGYGGAESSFLRLARELCRRHKVEIVVFTETYGRGGYTETAAPEGFVLHRLDSAQPQLRLMRWWRRVRRLYALKREFRADATISFLTGPNLLNALARPRGRTIVSVRGSRRFDAQLSQFQRWCYRWLVDPITHALADAVVCVSEGLRLEIGGQRGAHHYKFRAISGYVDSECLIAAAQGEIEPELEQLATMPVIVSAGRISREKGFQHLVRVFAGVREHVPDAKLLLIGDGPFRNELEVQCANVGLAHGALPDCDVILLGFRPQPHRYFRLGRTFALPSSSEGFPNIVVEALAAGTSVVAADMPWGTREVLGVAADPANRPFPRREAFEAPYGILMPPIDETRFDCEWVKILTEQLRQPPLTPEEVTRRRNRVRQLSCASAAARWEELLEELIVSHQGETPPRPCSYTGRWSVQGRSGERQA